MDRGGPTPAAPESPEAERGRSAPPSGWIIDRLALSPEQRTRVDSVVAFYGRHMSDFQADYRPRFRSIVDSTNRALMEVLTAEQRAAYDSIQAAAEHRRNRGDAPDRR